MAARVTRAKKKITARRHPVPGAAGQPSCPTGWTPCSPSCTWCSPPATRRRRGDVLVRTDLVDRALDLARLLRGLMPDEPEVRGLLALMLLTDARRATRQDDAGRLVLLADQDRDRWDRAECSRALALVRDLHHSRVGRFGVQAAIAAEHALAPSYAETDWPQVVALYDALLREWPSPVVALNRAVALARGRRPGGGPRRGGPAGRRRPAGGLPVPAGRPGRPAAPAGPAGGGTSRRTAGPSTRRTRDAERFFLRGRLAALD